MFSQKELIDNIERELNGDIAELMKNDSPKVYKIITDIYKNELMESTEKIQKQLRDDIVFISSFIGLKKTELEVVQQT